MPAGDRRLDAVLAASHRALGARQIKRSTREYPGSPRGWAMKATIEENHPGADLKPTYQYFVDNFGNDPNMQ